MVAYPNSYIVTLVVPGMDYGLQWILHYSPVFDDDISSVTTWPYIYLGLCRPTDRPTYGHWVTGLRHWRERGLARRTWADRDQVKSYLCHDDCDCEQHWTSCHCELTEHVTPIHTVNCIHTYRPTAGRSYNQLRQLATLRHNHCLCQVSITMPNISVSNRWEKI